ncbi:MAG: ferritin-like domain-containing protein [Methylophilaceae bacterium]|nr:ferritin-like domain-containing protein [Methylophilaceae bacterium]
MKLASTELRNVAMFLLATARPSKKVAGVMDMAALWRNGSMTLDSTIALKPSQTIPGQPEKPELVPPMQVKKRAMNTSKGCAILIHALAHIEFNAINLALDAIWRYADMPREYYEDWLKVAEEEAYHFSLLNTHLEALGYAYGDFPAHNSLWEMAEKTKDDILTRIALVPRTMEARGLDATPALRAKLAQAGDIKAAEILDIILRDEIGHVAIGNRWFNYLCEQRGLEAVAAYEKLAMDYQAPTLRGPFNIEARGMAGFTEAELALLL